MNQQNWKTRLNLANAANGFADDDRAAAMNWHTHPCAEAGCYMNHEGPVDAFLHYLGILFVEAVHEDAVEFAHECAASIIERAEWLKCNPPKSMMKRRA